MSGTKDFLDRCTSCGACAEACQLLAGRGTPDRVIARCDAEVFLCTGCGACTALCPSELLPSEALLETKYRLLTTGQVPGPVQKAVRGARQYAAWGHAFPFLYYSRTDTVFWPGCSLAGRTPEVVRKTLPLLSRKLGKQVGMALDCCHDPAYQVGDLDTVRAAAAGIKRRIEQRGITTIIAACTNCMKVFRRYLPGLRVDHVLDVLPAGARQTLAGESCYLHHPCPTYRFRSIQERAKGHLEQLGALVWEQDRPRCCGFGGNLHAVAPERSDVCTREVMAAAGNAPIVTYCMACTERFLEKGAETHHLLELLVSAQPTLRPVSSVRRWLNRLLLALRMRLMDRKVRKKWR